MKEQKVSFKTAKLAKEKGFDWECTDGYGSEGTEYFLEDYEDGDILFDNWNHLEYRYESDRTCCISAPTQSLLQKWLREKHNYHLWIIPWNSCKDFAYNWEYNGMNDGSKGIFKSYEEALEEGLYEALKLI